MTRSIQGKKLSFGSPTSQKFQRLQYSTLATTHCARKLFRAFTRAQQTISSATIKTKKRSMDHIKRFWTTKKYTISSLLITTSSWNSQSQAGSSDGRIKSLNYPIKWSILSSLTPTERNWLHSELSIRLKKPFKCSWNSGLILGCKYWMPGADWVRSTFLTKNTKCVLCPPWNWATSMEIS